MDKIKEKVEEENNLRFVQLIEENQVILSKSQVPEIKKKKTNAILELIPKWAHISGETLDVKSFKKKLHNMKSRTNSADKKLLSDWQKRLIELTGSNQNQSSSDAIKSSDNAEKKSILPQQKTNEMSCSSTNIGDVQAIGKRKAEDYLNSLESEVTKLMDNQQLKRCLMLKQMKLFDLQINKLENENTGLTLSESAVIYLNEEDCLDEETEKCDETGDETGDSTEAVN